MYIKRSMLCKLYLKKKQQHNYERSVYNDFFLLWKVWLFSFEQLCHKMSGLEDWTHTRKRLILWDMIQRQMQTSADNSNQEIPSNWLFWSPLNLLNKSRITICKLVPHFSEGYCYLKVVFWGICQPMNTMQLKLAFLQRDHGTFGLFLAYIHSGNSIYYTILGRQTCPHLCIST